ncbi:hypothetical protein [uncultured Christiangramia sp.]|uniref:hypothetical protein n=1 Tax=uncultured Christiangramia sp. TaxID=503836 RepID=UPI0025F5AD3F|nr:hypothetical protein [uncultured Christiangramia sp.]
MKLHRSSSYTAVFFLIFLIGLIIFVTIINKSLNEKSDLLNTTSTETPVITLVSASND